MNNRRYDIDALRVFAFGVLILYHVGMFYVADWGWHVKSEYLVDWLKYPMVLVNRWRLPLLFLISGLAVNFLLRKAGAGDFAWSRFKRLVVPLAFGMLVVVPPQAYFQALSNGAFSGNYFEFLVAYFTFRPWPVNAFDGSHVGITWNHLWYLPYLLVYSMLLAVLLPLLNGVRGTRLRERFRALRGVKLWVLPALPLIVSTWLLSGSFPSTHDLVSDWHMHTIYFTIFLYGYWIGTDRGMWAELQRLRWWLVGASVFTFSAFLLFAFITVPAPSVARATYDVFQYLNAWTWIMLVLAWGHHWLNRPFRWLPYATEAVYPWYILHQTITVVAGYQLAKYSLDPVVEPALVLAITVGGCLVLHEFVIRRVNGLRPLFGLKAAVRTQPQESVVRPDGVGV